MMLAYSKLLMFVLAKLGFSQLSSIEQDGMRDRHNSLRAAISTPCTAADMSTLAWDSSLAQGAEAWAANCVGDHASGAGSQFGENLWMQFGSDISASQYTSADMANAVNAWYSEGADAEWVKDSDGNYIEVKPRAPGNTPCVQPEGNGCVIGHFTAVIWATSTVVGCGVKACTAGMTISGTSYPYGVLVVCRYNPPANKPAAPGQSERLSMPFLPGTKCAACAGACSTPGLCDAGSTPTRCGDSCGTNTGQSCRFNSVNYPTCTGMVGQISSMLSQSGLAACNMAAVSSMVSPTCDLTCGKCSIPNGVGSSFCSASGPGTTVAATTAAATTDAATTTAATTVAATTAAATTAPASTAAATTAAGTTAVGTTAATTAGTTTVGATTASVSSTVTTMTNTDSTTTVGATTVTTMTNTDSTTTNGATTPSSASTTANTPTVVSTTANSATTSTSIKSGWSGNYQSQHAAAPKEVTGSLTLTMTDGAAFVLHAKAKMSLQEAIADILAHVSYDMVTILSIVASRRLEEDVWVLTSPNGIPMRRLSGSVAADYSIAIPAGVPVPTTTQMQSAQSGMTSALNIRMQSNQMTGITATGIVAGPVAVAESASFATGGLEDSSGSFKTHMLLSKLAALCLSVFF